MSEIMTEETRRICPNCKSGSISSDEKTCKSCAKKDVKKEMAVAGGGVAGFELPIGVKKEALDEVLERHRDVNEAQMVVFLKGLDETATNDIAEALKFHQWDYVADKLREAIVRESVRLKIREVVRKKAGGGGYTLYAPNKGKKHGAKPVGTFPTKLQAKRAELARFPPKDPKKLQRLRKEIEKLMKDPKKRAEAEKRAMQQHGTDTPHVPHRKGHARGRHIENKILAKILVKEVRRRVLGEGLFREEAKPSEWDDFVKKVSGAALESDKGYQRVKKRLDAELQGTLAKSLKLIQKQLGGNARVKPLGTKQTEDGRSYTAFTIIAETSDVGPIYVYAENGVPRVELSDQAKAAFAKVQPGTVTAIRGALSAAQEAMEQQGNLRGLIQQRDAYLAGLEKRADQMISQMSPLQLSMLKRLLVKKYRGTK